jgi:hypothetical protein
MTTNSMHDIESCSDMRDYILQSTGYNLKVEIVGNCVMLTN